MSHPLTNEMCKEIQLHIFNQTDEDCMRAAYDKGAADRLEQCIAWLQGYFFLKEDLLFINEELLIKELKAAMRPQEDNQ